MIWITAIAVLAAAGVIVYDRLRLRRTMNTMRSEEHTSELQSPYKSRMPSSA